MIFDVERVAESDHYLTCVDTEFHAAGDIDLRLIASAKTLDGLAAQQVSASA